MVQSKAATVDDYIAEVTPDRAPALRMVRDIARRTFTSCDERMAWGMPAYFRGDDVAFAFANQKQYLAIYGVPAALREAHAELLQGADCGKGCIRFRKPAQIDPTQIEALLRDAAAARSPADT